MLDGLAPYLDRTVLAVPRRLTDEEAWQPHIPLAFLLVTLARPRVLVELGTHRGDSYCAFCQGVDASGLSTRCYAVDTWAGGARAGFGLDGDAVLDDLRRHHDPLYSSFSTLMQMTFDEALGHFADGEIDLLHLDGEPTYEAVRHDIENWLPKLSPRGVVVLHDTNERREGFGVRRVWGTLSERYPGFDVPHGHGLGVVAVGSEAPEAITGFIDAMRRQPADGQELFAALGERIVARRRAGELAATVAGQAAELGHEQDERARQDVHVRELAAQVDWLEDRRSELEAAVRKLEATEAHAVDLDEQLALMTRSMSWRLTSPLRAGKQALLRRSGRSPQRPGQALNGSPDVQQPPIVSRSGRALQIRPLISLIVPTWNTDPHLLRKTIASVKAQTYSNWELCIADDGSTRSETRATLRRAAADDKRISVTFGERNEGISAASNAALRHAKGEFVAFLDHDDLLDPHALYEFVALLDERPDTDVVYSDEDKIDVRGRRSDPFFKPDWSPEYFRGVMYVGHLLMIRRSTVELVGGLDSRFDGVQDYELMLRISEATDRIEHLPLVLYHWRTSPGSVAAEMDAKPQVAERQVAAVQEHLDRLGIRAVAEKHPRFGHRAVMTPAPRDAWPSVSIVVPSKDSPRHIGRCLDSIYGRTQYESYEVIVVDNRTTDPEALTILDRHPVKVVPFDERFNFSRACNVGVGASTGDFVLLLNNDTEVVDPNWLATLVSQAQLPSVGAVGPLLLDPQGRVQHAGVVLGLRGTADHILREAPPEADGYAGSLACTREVSAVTAACLIASRAVYEGLGGLDEYYGTHYQDVDFCLRLRERGYRVLFTPRTRLIHYESATRGGTYDHLDRALLLDRWGAVIRLGDPYYNPNFSLASTDYQVGRVHAVRA